MSSVARRGWHAVRRNVAGDLTERDAEVLRQMSDVFKELAHLSVDLGAVWRSVQDLREQLDVQAAVLAELVDATTLQIDLGNQSTELLGRLLESARARLDVLEGATHNSA